MRAIESNIEAVAECPLCDVVVRLTHLVAPHTYDLTPMARHIVAHHPEKRDSKEVPNIRILWKVMDEPPPRT